MFGFFGKKENKLAISAKALEKLLDEIEALLKQAHPDKICDGPCKHMNPEKDMPILQELLPRTMLLYMTDIHPKAEVMLQKLIGMYIGCFLKKNDIDYIKV